MKDRKPKSKVNVTPERLRELVHYDPQTGIFTRRVSTCGKTHVGKVIGCQNTRGYLQISIDSRLYLASRLAFLYMTGKWPEHQVDHRNHVLTDNRWNNIRDVTQSVNMQNQVRPGRGNKTGYLGVSVDGDRFAATIKVDKKTIMLGRFDDPAMASKTYLQAKRALHPGNTI